MKKRSMKVLFLLLVFLISVPILGARKKITIWCTDKEAPALNSMKMDYKKEQKIDVEIVIKRAIGGSGFSITAWQGGDAPDIVVGNSGVMVELAKQNSIAELSLTSTQISKYHPNSIQAQTYNGKIYGVPLNLASLALLYNKSLLKEPPKTWEELITVAKKLTNQSLGKSGFLYGIDNNFYPNFLFPASQGGYVFKWDAVKKEYQTLDIGLDNPGAIEGFKFIYRLVQEGVVPPSTSNDVAQNQFMEGKVAMIMDGPWRLRNYAEKIDVGVAKLPTLKGKKSTPFVEVKGMMINAGSKLKREAMDFVLNYAGEYKGQLEMFKVTGIPPAHIEASNAVVKSEPIIKPFLDSALDGIVLPNVFAMHYAFMYGARIIDLFKKGEVSVENAVNTQVKMMREIIAEKVCVESCTADYQKCMQKASQNESKKTACMNKMTACSSKCKK